MIEHTQFSTIYHLIYKYFFLNQHRLIHISHTKTYSLKKENNYTRRVLSSNFLLLNKRQTKIKYKSQAADIRMAERVNS